MKPTVQKWLEELRAEFERCWPWIEASLEPSGLYRTDGSFWPAYEKRHVWERIVAGKVFFWPGKECVVLTEFRVTPTGIKSHHNWVAGGDLAEIKGMMPEIEEWGKQQGCHQQTGDGRDGWLRVFDGYQKVGVRKTKILDARFSKFRPSLASHIN